MTISSISPRPSPSRRRRPRRHAGTLLGESILLRDRRPTATVRDDVFSHRWPWYPGVEQTRYASSGIFDGRYKYCRYYGIGGGTDAVA